MYNGSYIIWRSVIMNFAFLTADPAAGSMFASIFSLVLIVVVDRKSVV